MHRGGSGSCEYKYSVLRPGTVRGGNDAACILDAGRTVRKGDGPRKELGVGDARPLGMPVHEGGSGSKAPASCEGSVAQAYPDLLFSGESSAGINEAAPARMPRLVRGINRLQVQLPTQLTRSSLCHLGDRPAGGESGSFGLQLRGCMEMAGCGRTVTACRGPR